MPPQQNGNVGVAKPQQTAVGMAPGRTSGLGARSRGIAVAPLKLEGEEPFSKAFMSKVSPYCMWNHSQVEPTRQDTPKEG